MDLLDFIVIMFGATLVLVGTALLFYYKKAKARQKLLDPHRDHLYHYTKPSIRNIQDEYNEYRRRKKA